MKDINIGPGALLLPGAQCRRMLATADGGGTMSIATADIGARHHQTLTGPPPAAC